MKHLRKFNESTNIYDIDWHEIVPKNLTMIYADKPYEFVCNKDTNIMKHFDMIQVTYTIFESVESIYKQLITKWEQEQKKLGKNTKPGQGTRNRLMKEAKIKFLENKKGGQGVWGLSDTLEFDLYFLKPYQSKGIKIDVDISWGNFMESEFSIQSDKVSVIQCTTKDSKFDPTNTVFAFDDSSLDKLVKFFNSFQGININKEDIMFLHKEGRCPI